MKTLNEHLAQYAAYHRDPRNIATHFVGIPMIFLAIIVLLSRPVLVSLSTVPLTPALVLSCMVAIYYVWLDLRYGLVMAGVFVMCLLLANELAAQSTTLWLSMGIGLFVVGWIIQFIGHYYEGKKPAFVDDLMGLLIGPLFILVEFGFALRLRKEVQLAIEAQVGKVRIREKSH
ncbi:MAG: DUF962 domain-containing protein [Burkholderiaceae bacterium]|nr:DUF962 domain-containing protein [Burkholderiaceae bacterium]